MVNNDKQYLKDILRKLRVKEEPKSIDHVGKPNESKKCVIIICIKTKEANSRALSNIGLLKGTEEMLGKSASLNIIRCPKGSSLEKNDPTRVKFFQKRLQDYLVNLEGDEESKEIKQRKRKMIMLQT